MSTLRQQGWTWFRQSLTQHDTFLGYFQPLIQVIAPQWTTDAYRARVVAIRDEIPGMYSLILKPKTTLLDRYWPMFEAGQFIELLIEKEGRRLSRCFSISSSPAYYEKTGRIELSIRIQEKGRVTPWLYDQLSTGDVVNISRAQGEFLLPPNFPNDLVSKSHSADISSAPQKYLFIAGGSGITPFRSMLQQQALLNSSATPADIHLLYYSRDSQHIAFQQELEALQQAHRNITISFIDSNSAGFICAQHLRTYCSDYYQRDVFICGPSPMIQQARTVLQQLEVSSQKIHFEFFGAAPLALEKSETGVVLFQSSHKTSVTKEETISTLLEQAEREGVSAVSGCRIGVCHQCICKKKSGIVFNTRTQEYSDSGVEDIQLCISVAQGDVVLDL